MSDPLGVRPPLIGEWVVPLPQSSKGKTRAASELHFVSDNIFLALSRDGHGNGGSSDSSSYKYVYRLCHGSKRLVTELRLLGCIRQADLVDISSATDIHGTKFDDPSNPISPDGDLDKSITPAQYVGFVNYVNDTQLARFGLHNGEELFYVDLSLAVIDSA